MADILLDNEGLPSTPPAGKSILFSDSQSKKFAQLDDQGVAHGILSASYPPLEYVVQYRESDLAFISRLLEQAGIYYFFKHQADKHTLVLADGLDAHVAAPDYEGISFIAADRHRDPLVEYIDH